MGELLYNIGEGSAYLRSWIYGYLRSPFMILSLKTNTKYIKGFNVTALEIRRPLHLVFDIESDFKSVNNNLNVKCLHHVTENKATGTTYMPDAFPFYN